MTKPAYESPALTELGSLEELTQLKSHKGTAPFIDISFNKHTIVVTIGGPIGITGSGLHH